MRMFHMEQSPADSRQVRPRGRTGRWTPGRGRPGLARLLIEDRPGDRTAAGVATDRLLRLIGRGLPLRELDELAARLELTREEIAELLGASRTTLHRRQVRGRLDAAQSDRLVTLARLFGAAVKALGAEERARVWLKSVQPALGGATPLAYARSETGAREVEVLLGRIAYGAYA